MVQNLLRFRRIALLEPDTRDIGKLGRGHHIYGEGGFESYRSIEVYTAVYTCIRVDILQLLSVMQYADMKYLPVCLYLSMPVCLYA
jgi:hypothetical protein